MLPQQYCLRWKYHHSNLQTMFSQLLDRGCFCDVTLACEGQLIRAHRVVLCACSTFFDTVLTNYASERDPIIIMKDVTFADVKCLIEFMYKGEINVEHAHLASLLKTADDLKIKGLAEVSWREDDDNAPPLPTPATEFHSPTRVSDTYTLTHEHHRDSPRSTDAARERKSASPSAAKHAQTRLPTLTPIPTATNSISIAASPVDHYLGPKRKRGRPPLDDTYDVFNVRKLAHYAAHMDHQHQHQAYLDSRHFGDEHRQPAVSPTSSAAAAAAYQHHIHQQQSKQRMRHRQQQQPESDELPHDDTHPDPEWITSNLEVNVSECEQQSANENGSDIVDIEIKEHKVEIEETEMVQTSNISRPTKYEKKQRERTPEQRKKLVRHNSDDDEQHERTTVQDKERNREIREREEEEKDERESLRIPQPVEEIESVHQVLEQQLPAAAAAATSSGSSSSTASSPSASHKTSTHTQGTIAAPPLPPPLHHPHFGKYAHAPDGYLLNEHGMLMTHDFVHAPTANIPAASSTTTSGASSSTAASNGNHDHDFVDIKMEDYDAAELRLTSEEMTQWQDVIKMDDYLAKGRRPQFWEEPFTRRVLDAIKNKRLEMKKAARILGVSYGTLYGRYREVYGCLKHPYSNSTAFRPSQSSQLAVQPRFDIVWPSPKRDAGLLPGQLEIGKIRPKDMSELWTRPQI